VTGLAARQDACEGPDETTGRTTPPRPKLRPIRRCGATKAAVLVIVFGAHAGLAHSYRPCVYAVDQLYQKQVIESRRASLLDVRRLRLRLLDLLHRLCGSLVDVEGELHVVVVDANTIVRLQRAAQEEPRDLVFELSLDRAS